MNKCEKYEESSSSPQFVKEKLLGTLMLNVDIDDDMKKQRKNSER
jgi:hypothetical protein